MKLIDRITIIQRQLIKDDRGWFLKAITGTEENLPSYTGEVYLTMGKPGEIKGGHYHMEAVEWFTVIAGKALLRLEDIETKERIEIKMSLETSQTVFVPCNVAHDFKNIGDTDFIVLAYTDKLYKPEDTIRYVL